jgi:hypothetical protein
LLGVAGGLTGALTATLAHTHRVLGVAPDGVDDGNPWHVGTLADTQATTSLRNNDTDATYPPVMRITNATNTAIEAISGTGFGLHAESTGSGWSSIAALKENSGSAVLGHCVDPSSGFAAIDAWTAGTGAAVHGESGKGRGGQFKGKKAQVRLDPSSAGTHPGSGAAGDLFVDASNRLWFCRGGSSWRRLA